MELQSARQIIDTLAQGVHPVTGELMPEDSPYNAPPVIRALFAVARALDGKPGEGKTGEAAPPKARILPPNAGKPWTGSDDAQLAERFVEGMDLRPLAEELGRTRYAVESRLIRIGKLPPREAGRFA